MTRLTLIALTLFVAAGCQPGPLPPVPLAGSFASLAGEWSGSYESPQSGRSGSIAFTLEPGDDHAHGDVTMIPRGSTAPFRAARQEFPEDAGVMPAQLLNIRFVRVAGDSVSGAIEPYTDPECACAAVTRFRGLVRGNRIEGVFTTTRADRSGTLRGTWMVGRVR